MSNKRPFFKISGVISVLILAALTLAACGNSEIAAQLNDGKLTICHATGSASATYDKITLDFKQLAAHVSHQDDLIPAPAGGCPKTVETGQNNGKITICHATSSAANPYNEITISINGLNGHSKHARDIIPAPESGCPATTPTATPTVTATPTITNTPTITATPTITETPTITTTPTVTNTPAATAPGNDGKITICHATGSAKNPYVMITISVNGLNGHNKHPRDIIPAPAGGCPNK